MAAAGDSIEALIPSFARSLRARNRSPRTISSYVGTAEMFAEFLKAKRLKRRSVRDVTRSDVELFVEDQLQRNSASTAASRYRYLQQFFRWATAEDEIERSPMDGMSPPSVGEKPVPVLADDELTSLLKACDGKTFEDRRDTAIVRLFIDTGIRLGEMAGIAVADLDLDRQCVVVTGKGNRGHVVTFGNKSALALDRYLRLRGRHRQHESPMLWVGPKGALTDSGITQVLKRRAGSAGIDGMHAHRFRHTFAHRWLANGGSEGDLQAIANWKSPQMLARYGASARAERAAASARRLALGDSL